jgi:two-component system, LytTR family, sensor kinase
MNRILLHISFWIVFISQRVLNEYLWAKDKLPDSVDFVLLRDTSISSFLFTIPEIIFAYYLAYIGLERIFNKKRNIIFRILEISLVLFICIWSVRIIVAYFVFPYIYHLEPSPVFEVRRAIWVFFNFVFSSGILLAIKSVRSDLKNKEREKNLINEKLSTELKLLRNQINPHFLFNSLNNIYALSRKKSDNAPDAIMKLSDLLSFMLYESGKETISIQEEMSFLKDYIELQKIRYDEKLTLKIEENIDNPNEQITPLLFIPLIENAFKHGVEENTGDSFIFITIMLKNRQLKFVIENNFESVHPKKDKENIGLVNTKRQLELLYTKHTFEVIKSEYIFKVLITINLDSHGKI